MSSTLSIINWAPTQITPTLNGMQLPALKPSDPQDFYYPYNLDVRRVTGAPGSGEWGDVNNLLLRSTDSSTTQIYNSLADPASASANIALLLWVFPGFSMFSQIGNWLQTVYPDTGTA